MITDDLPPLEDFSELIEKRQKEKEEKQKLKRIAAERKLQAQKAKELEKATQPKIPAFGFKKGFLLAENKVKAPKKKIEVIKPKKTDNPLKIDEVQEAMKSQFSLLDKQECLNEDFMKKIDSNPKLSEAFEDPMFQVAADEVSKDPRSIMKWSKTHPHLVEALKEFCGILGSAFDELHRLKIKENVKVPEDLPSHEKALIDRVLGDTEVQDILKDPEIQRILAQIQHNPPSLPSIMKSLNDKQFKAINKLIEIGLLSIKN